jgi:hypothetical protein
VASTVQRLENPPVGPQGPPSSSSN